MPELPVSGAPSQSARDAIRAYVRSLPRPARRQLPLTYVQGVPSAVCALLPWVLPLVLTAWAVIAAVAFSWPPDVTLFSTVGTFCVSLVGAFGLARAIQSAALYARLASFSSGQLPVCPQCSYSQHGIETDRCPECGCPTRIN